MNQTKFQFEIIGMLIGFILVGVFFAGNNVHARCRWIWKGTNSYYVCDDDRELRKGVSICNFSTVRDKNGIPKTITVFCRADGSPWKKVIVEPKQVIMKMLRSDGSVEQQKRINISRHRALEPEHTERRKPHRDKPKWKSKNWQTTVMGMKIKGQVQRKLNKVQGYLKIPMPFTGKLKTYTFRGHINGRNVVARSGGHSFRGKIRSDGRVSGTVNVDGGPKIPFVSPFTLP